LIHPITDSEIHIIDSISYTCYLDFKFVKNKYIYNSFLEAPTVISRRFFIFELPELTGTLMNFDMPCRFTQDIYRCRSPPF